MKLYFYIGSIGLILFEILNVFFIMPMPGSQEINSIDLAYFLYTHRWLFRAFFVLMMIAGIVSSYQTKRKWIPALVILIMLGVTYLFNFKMNADKMFLQPEKLILKTKANNLLPLSSVILGVENNGEAKAYPIRFLTYHHQVLDTIGGKPMIVTYCSVCRTGRVYEPVVNKKQEVFRLVGMDHFNAMFEDRTTKSWWRQSTGEAITGPLKGQVLPEVSSYQMTLEKWLDLHPNALVMQTDNASRMEYDSLGKFEIGKSKGPLTKTDSSSWNRKSWVVGIELNKQSKAWDWNELKKVKLINDELGGKTILIAIANDNKSFVAFERPDTAHFIIRNDTLISGTNKYDFAGRNISYPNKNLKQINAYQEFWHSWKTFHPGTGKK